MSIVKIDEGEYKINFTLENNSIQVDKIIDFNIIKLLYDLNTDIYEKIDLKIMNDKEANLLVINKHLFQDLGISQKYTYFKINKKHLKNENKIIFDLTSSNGKEVVDLIPQNAQQLPVKNAAVVCETINIHKIQVEFYFKIDIELIEFPDIIEKVLSTIFIKKIKRIKQFIENITL